MEIKPIARFRSPFSSKFGIPKQAGLVAELEGQIVFEPEYRNPDSSEEWKVSIFSGLFGSFRQISIWRTVRL